MKQIEPGCLCVAITKVNAGRVFTAERLVIGDGCWVEADGVLWGPTTPGVRYWVISGEHINYTDLRPTPTIFKAGLARENQLMRIDGREPEKTTEQQKEVSTC